MSEKIKIDLKDRKILYELDRDSSQTNKQIAKKVRLSEMVVGNKIKRLKNFGVIENFYVKTNPSRLGYFHIKIYLRLHKITKAKEEGLINHLKKQEGIFWLASLRGKYDLVLSIYVKNIFEFSKKYEEILSEWQRYILDRNVLILERAYTFTKAHLIQEKFSEEIIYSEGGRTNLSIDERDKELLKILSKNSRDSYVKIAEKLKVSADTIKYRIKNLQKKGIITGFGTKINFNKLGNNYNIVFLKLQNMDSKKYNYLKEFSKLNKNIIIYIKMIGDHDVELETETHTKEEFHELIKEIRENFVNELKDYEIIDVTKEYLMNYFPFN